MDYFFAQALDGTDLFGAPAPAPGVRTVFVVELLLAARERRLGRPVEHELTGDEGLVVEEDPREVLTWPCRLWRVGDVEGVVRLQADNKWFRCRAFTVLEELPAWLVMGDRGDAVLAVIEQARALTVEQVRDLAAMDDADERRLQRQAWDRWLARGQHRSPLGRGLDLAYSAVVEAARRTGDELFAWDDDDGVEVLADPAWQQAGHAAVAAATALGAPEVFDGLEAELAARRWNAVTGGSGTEEPGDALEDGGR